MDEQHVYHHSAQDGPHIAVKVEKNTKGYNFEASITNAASVDQALALVDELITRLQAQYGGGG
jgi:hypothetical protein